MVNEILVWVGNKSVPITRTKMKKLITDVELILSSGKIVRNRDIPVYLSNFWNTIKNLDTLTPSIRADLKRKFLNTVEGWIKKFNSTEVNRRTAEIAAVTAKIEYKNKQIQHFTKKFQTEEKNTGQASVETRIDLEDNKEEKRRLEEQKARLKELRIKLKFSLREELAAFRLRSEQSQINYAKVERQRLDIKFKQAKKVKAQVAAVVIPIRETAIQKLADRKLKEIDKQLAELKTLAKARIKDEKIAKANAAKEAQKLNNIYKEIATKEQQRLRKWEQTKLAFEKERKEAKIAWENKIAAQKFEFEKKQQEQILKQEQAKRELELTKTIQAQALAQKRGENALAFQQQKLALQQQILNLKEEVSKNKRSKATVTSLDSFINIGGIDIDPKLIAVSGGGLILLIVLIKTLKR